MYKNPYFNQMQANFQQQQAQFLAQQQAEYQKQFASMTDEHKQKFAALMILKRQLQ